MPKKKDNHDDKTCFRCRLYHLIRELYPNGFPDTHEIQFVLHCMAEASGQMLFELGPDSAKFFFMDILKEIEEAKDEDDQKETMH